MVQGDLEDLGVPGAPGRPLARCPQQQRPAARPHCPCRWAAAGSRGRLGGHLEGGQGCLPGQGGQGGQGAPSLQEARGALAAPRGPEAPLGPSLPPGPGHLWSLGGLQALVVPSAPGARLGLWVFSFGAPGGRGGWHLGGNPRSRAVGCSGAPAGRCLGLRAVLQLPAGEPWPPAWSAAHSCR